MDRIQKAKNLLDRLSVDALFIQNPIDLYYLTGFLVSAGRLLILKDQALLMLDGRYYEKYKRHPALRIFLSESSENDFLNMKGFLSEKARIGFDAEYTTFSHYEELAQLKGSLVALKKPIQILREVKEPLEIEALIESGKLASKGYDYALNLIKDNITEGEIALELELFWRKSGGEGLAFNPHIAFGAHTAFPHYHGGATELKRGDAILIDIGVVKQKYHSDMTRVVFYHELSSEMEKIYQVVKDAQSKALELCKAGASIKKIDLAAREWIAQKGYGKFFPHSLGHGVGLEIHESPAIRSVGPSADRCLKESMVITIEPGIYIPGVGGVRLEDMILITKDGFENLTNRPISASLPLIHN